MHSAVTDFPWSRYRRLIDMGGAYGSFLAALLRRCPRSEGVLFDQPQARPSSPPPASQLHAPSLLHLGCLFPCLSLK